MSRDIDIACICPTKDGSVRHPDGDTISLRDKLGFRHVEAIRSQVGIFALEEPDAELSDSLAIFAEGYILHGIESWTLAEDDEKGKEIALRPSRSNIRKYILDDIGTADLVSTIADELYAQAVMLPLLNRALPSSPGTPTAKSTSRSRTSGKKRPTPSKPSSTSTSQTAGIGKITSLHAGDSSSLPSSESAA